jgi:hypothetical protein
MPSATSDGNAPASRVRTLITIPVEHTVVSTICCIDLTNALQPNDAYAEIGLMSGGTTPQNKIAALAAGYIGKDCPVAWSGKIITDPDMFLYAVVFSSIGGPFRLAALVNPYKIGADGGIILDP